MERKQIYLADEQEEALKRIAYEEHTSVSQVIRDAVAAYIVDREEPQIAEAEAHPLWAIIGAASDPAMPTNGSVAHDEVVYRPRRRSRKQS